MGWRSFEEIEAWRKARGLVVDLYAVTRSGEFARDFGLRDQVQRSAVSVMSNIAEGFERAGNKEFVQFLAVAKGSAGELRSHLYVALDLGYIPKDAFEALRARTDEVSRLLDGLISYLRSSPLKGRRLAPSSSGP